MKFLTFAIFTLLFVFTTTPALADVCNVGRTNSFDNTGSLQAGSRDICWIKVSNVDQGSLTKGFVVISDSSSDEGYVIASSTDPNAVPLCVLMETCAQGAKCKCQIYGYADFIQFEDASPDATAGNLMFISDGSLGSAGAIGDTSIAASNNPFGVFLEAQTASGDTKGYIRLK